MKNKTIVVGIHGKFESGKDSFSKRLKERFDGRTDTLHFAYRLKEAVKQIFRLTNDDVYTTEGKERYIEKFGMRVREILQKFGTEVGRQIYKDIWVWNVLQDLKEIREIEEAFGYSKSIVTIPDLRFLNEFDFLKYELKNTPEFDVYTVKIVRHNHTTNYDGSVLQHQSETDLDKVADNAWDFVYSAENLDQLYDHVEKFLMEIKK